MTGEFAPWQGDSGAPGPLSLCFGFTVLGDRDRVNSQSRQAVKDSHKASPWGSGLYVGGQTLSSSAMELVSPLGEEEEGRLDSHLRQGLGSEHAVCLQAGEVPP